MATLLLEDVEARQLIPVGLGTVFTIYITVEHFETGEPYLAFEVTSPVGLQMRFIDSVYIRHAQGVIDICNLEGIENETDGAFVSVSGDSSLTIDGARIGTEVFVGRGTRVNIISATLTGKIVASSEGSSHDITVEGGSIGDETRLWSVAGRVKVSNATVGSDCIVAARVGMNNVIADGSKVLSDLPDQMERTLADPDLLRALSAV